MPRKTYITATNCITPLGFDVETNIQNIEKEISGIVSHTNKKFSQNSFLGAIIDDAKLETEFNKISQIDGFTKLEKMLILALKPIIQKTPTEKTALILSTTKGNISELNTSSDEISEKVYLQNLAKTIADFFDFKTQPIVVSNACVSGILAIATAKRLIQAEIYDDAYVIAGDEFSEFVLSGFTSFQALSDTPCKPYDEARNGLNLGEATAAVFITSDENLVKKNDIKIIGDGAVNDANHISGPSRTGEGLFRSIKSAMNEANIESSQIEFISAHGTATIYNDEMESIAFSRLEVQNVPINSLKGYYGHTLGASGLLETVIGIESLKRNRLYKSLGFENPGTSERINVITENKDIALKIFLKTASGFGGCNTAVIFEKI
mgnify:FL=1